MIIQIIHFTNMQPLYTDNVDYITLVSKPMLSNFLLD